MLQCTLGMSSNHLLLGTAPVALANYHVVGSERPNAQFLSAKFGHTMWGQSSAEPCRTVQNKVRQQRTAKTYGNNLSFKLNYPRTSHRTANVSKSLLAFAVPNDFNFHPLYLLAVAVRLTITANLLATLYPLAQHVTLKRTESKTVI